MDINDYKNKIKNKQTHHELAKQTHHELAFTRTMLAEERTLLSQIRTASIFIGITYILIYKISFQHIFFEYSVVLILFIIFCTNNYSMYLFYKKNMSHFDNYDRISIIYGVLLSILVLLSLFYIIFYSIYGKNLK